MCSVINVHPGTETQNTGLWQQRTNAKFRWWCPELNLTFWDWDGFFCFCFCFLFVILFIYLFIFVRVWLNWFNPLSFWHPLDIGFKCRKIDWIALKTTVAESRSHKHLNFPPGAFSSSLFFLCMCVCVLDDCWATTLVGPKIRSKTTKPKPVAQSHKQSHSRKDPGFKSSVSILDDYWADSCAQG